jgi:HrpA-like RNA helicase
MPIEPHLGKMLLYASHMQCLGAALTIASYLSFDEVCFLKPCFCPNPSQSLQDIRKADPSLLQTRESYFNSDLLTAASLFEQFESASATHREAEFCARNGINIKSALRTIT